MKALLFPFHLDLNGHIATTTAYPEVIRGQLIDVLMTNHGERVMRPGYGANMRAALFDPAEELVRADAAQQTMDAIQTWAPRVTMQSVGFSIDRMKPGDLYVDVLYRAGQFDEVRSLKMPTLAFIDQESDL
jgi:phage baseplate assembly protein W